MKLVLAFVLAAASILIANAQECQVSTDCEDGYTCSPATNGTNYSVCYPIATLATLPATLPPFTLYTFTAVPTLTWTLRPTFTVTESTTPTLTVTTTVICTTVTYTITPTNWPTTTYVTDPPPPTTTTTISTSQTYPTTKPTSTIITDSTTQISTTTYPTTKPTSTSQNSTIITRTPPPTSSTTIQTTIITTQNSTTTYPTTIITTKTPLPSSSTTWQTSTSPTYSPTCDVPPPPQPTKVRFAGINIAGIDFSVDINGNYNPAAAIPPLLPYGGLDGQGQMQHFVNDDGFNIFRLPVTWQFLTGSTSSGSFDPTNWGEYLTLVKICLSNANTYCIIDLHNYARFSGGIVGQGGPPNGDFYNFWYQIASTFAGIPQIIFGLQNEPHDLSVPAWANTLQIGVQAIRAAGAKQQIILLPGTDFASATTFVSSGSAAALNAIIDPVGGTNLLVFDVQKFLDKPGNGTLPDCVEDGIASALGPLSQWLRCNKRQALVTATGGGNTKTCLSFLCNEIAFIKANSDVYLGYLGWAAGNEPSSYPLVETPTNTGSLWVDQPIIQCLLP